jgi:membrane fusion protein
MSSPNSLFRTEALLAKQTGWLGPVLLMRPLSFALIVWGAVFAAVAILALLSFGEYTKRARITGLLVPDKGFIKVVPHQAGVIIAKHVKEGQVVKAGEALFTLSLERIAAGGGHW